MPLPNRLIVQHPGQAVSAVVAHRFLLGIVAIFLYVGGEVAIGSFLINFLGSEAVGAMTVAQAAHYVAFYWGGAMLGRFIGAALM